MTSSLKAFSVAAMMLTATSFQAVADIAVLDMTKRNREVENAGDWSRSVYSATYMCDIAGYRYSVVEDLEEAMSNRVILFSNCITSYSFTREEWETLDAWVKDGGIIVSPAFRNVYVESKDVVDSLFGIDSSNSGTKASNRVLINWNPEYFGDKELEYIDEEHERATSVGEVKTYSLATTEAEVLATYEDGTPAVARHSHGKGKTYLSQVTWRDVVARNQLNKDQKSSREYNNGFEPSSDVWALFLRSIYSASSDVAVWKFTVPGGYTQLLVPTHDCDSRTAYDEMHWMAEYEKSLGFRGHYFLTVHYYSDKENFGHSYLSAFYNEETIPKALELLKEGHTVGSHSIGHFPDFSSTRNTDVVSKEEYAFRATCLDGKSSGVSTWAEIVMSKQILQEDLGNDVRSFRSGHLCVNPDFGKMLKEGDYTFQSCYTGGDILSEFPFFGRIGNSWEGDQSEVLTMQLHISDVYNNKEGVMPLNDDTWDEHPAPDDWYAAMEKLRGNYANAVLLIHPNREWKMTLQKKLIDRLDLSEVGLYNFEDYGDFWLTRLNADYDYDFNNENGILTVTTDTEAMLRHKMTFAVDVKDSVISGAVVADAESGEEVEAELRQISDGRYLVIPTSYGYGSNVDTIRSDMNDEWAGIFDINGRMIYSGEDPESVKSSLPKGIYIMRSQSKTYKLKI